MGRITNNIPVSAADSCGPMVTAAAQAALMRVIIIIEGTMKLP
ncbi:MAG: hypothetical protein ACYS4W_08125 [Planctomycetota bacterium]